MKLIDWVVVALLGGLIIMGAWSARNVHASPDLEGRMIPVKFVCDDPSVFRQIFMQKDEAKQRAVVEEALDSGTCVGLGAAMPATVETAVDEFMTDDATITVVKLKGGEVYAFVYEPAVQT